MMNKINIKHYKATKIKMTMKTSNINRINKLKMQQTNNKKTKMSFINLNNLMMIIKLPSNLRKFN